MVGEDASVMEGEAAMIGEDALEEGAGAGVGEGRVGAGKGRVSSKFMVELKFG